MSDAAQIEFMWFRCSECDQTYGQQVPDDPTDLFIYREGNRCEREDCYGELMPWDRKPYDRRRWAERLIQEERDIVKPVEPFKLSPDERPEDVAKDLANEIAQLQLALESLYPGESEQL